jgi:hypothetical protein
MRTPTWLCTECGYALADAATSRRVRGLAPRSPYSATCSDRCERIRERRFWREAASRGHELGPGDWCCAECGRSAEGPLRVTSVTCSAACYRSRMARRTAALMREAQRRPDVKARRKRWRQELARRAA